MIQDIMASIEDVVLAFAVPSDGRNISTSDREYVLQNAKQVPGFVTYAPFGNGKDAAAAQAFNDQFLNSSIMLLPDSYTDAFRSAFEGVQEQGYNYKTNIESAAGTGPNTFQSIRDLQFLSREGEAIVASYPSGQTPFTISAPGKYAMQLDALWSGGSKKADYLGVFIDKGNTFTSLEAMDSQNNPQTTYADNPFMQMAFDGLTGGTQRADFGMGYATLAAFDNRVALKGNVGFAAGGANQPSVTTYDDQQPTAAANKIAQFTNKAGRPALFKLQKLGDAWSFDYAPNRIAPVKTTLFSTQVPIYQYIVADAVLANTTGAYNYDPGIITWVDCSSTSVNFFTANKGAQNALMCNPSRVNDFVLNGTRSGTDYSYLGVALLPPGDTPLYMYPICARDSASIQNAVQNTPTQLSVDNPTQQLSQVELKATVAAPKDLWEMIQYINNGTACASIDQDKLDIIWNLGSTAVVPSKLLCQATGANNIPIAPQAAATP
ncbi:MAG: hypothetical protein IPJ89_02625 [Candidatus Iainarchaeum archaeon]|uniref:Uncharacterized protein n=1 Tax=Candidatus Iainarchaeum sp. TaxID=3101447 RepID=A0A7T9I1K3_9ARCH|nr:MAG: hypothetical protein IPJ89_02625 [Candidatus Diapherotrites archaeon]